MFTRPFSLELKQFTSPERCLFSSLISVAKAACLGIKHKAGHILTLEQKIYNVTYTKRKCFDHHKRHASQSNGVCTEFSCVLLGWYEGHCWNALAYSVLQVSLMGQYQMPLTFHFSLGSVWLGCMTRLESRAGARGVGRGGASCEMLSSEHGMTDAHGSSQCQASQKSSTDGEGLWKHPAEDLLTVNGCQGREGHFSLGM